MSSSMYTNRADATLPRSHYFSPQSVWFFIHNTVYFDLHQYFFPNLMQADTIRNTVAFW